MLRPTVLSLLALLAGCGGADGTARAPVPSAEAAAAPDVGVAVTAPDLAAEAAQVWRDGAAGWTPPEPSTGAKRLGSRAHDGEPFERLDPASWAFVQRPSVRDAVPFSCAIGTYPMESRVTRALEEGSPNLRLLALSILMRVRAPSTVDAQWATLEALEQDEVLTGNDEAVRLLEDLRDAFSEGAVDDLLSADPPTERHADAHALEWACRAAGVRLHDALLPRLVELSRGDHLDVSLAAGRSIEDFPGTTGDDALAQCLLGWRYDAYVRAARALLRRNPRLLEETLLTATPPDKCRYEQGVFLGRLGSAAAVPILCETLPDYRIIDREMFDLVERLAQREHLDLVDALPGRVDDRQRERALAVQAAVRERLGLESD